MSAAFDEVLARVSNLGRTIVAPAAADVDRHARFPAEAIDALRNERLLSAYVAPELGGLGLSMTQISRVCEVLGRYCASTAMVYAMHQIQVAVLVHHAGSSAFFRNFLRQLVERQLLLASATTEESVGGDLRSSICALEFRGDEFTLRKTAPVISYGQAADGILVTCRRSAAAPRADQILVLVQRTETTLKPIGDWDTLGFRGTCSGGFQLTASGRAGQIVPEPFSEILSQTMQPFSHMVWISLWLGLAQDAADRARASVLRKARQQSALPEVSALRLVELDEVLLQMRGVLYQTMAEYQRLLDLGARSALLSNEFIRRVNNAKVTCSELVVDIVTRALRIIGISAYRNGSEDSLCRQLRDAHGAALMVNNDRIRRGSSYLQLLAPRST